MKKFIAMIAIVVITIVTLSACDKERTKTYEGDIDGKHVITSLTYKNNKVISQSTISTLKYDDMSLSEKEGKALFKKHKALENAKGVDYRLTSERDKIDEKVDIDYNKADIQKIKRNFDLFSYDKNNHKVNMENSVKYLKKLGFEEKSKMTK